MTQSSTITDFDDFAKVHAILLAASGIPPALHRLIFYKLYNEIFDGGDFFTIEQCEGGLQRRLLFSAKFLPMESDIFLIDHAWTFRLSDALKQLKELPGLAERMAALMCVDLDLEPDSIGVREVESGESLENGIEKNVSEILEREMERGSHSATWLELEELGINDDMLSSLDLPTRFPNLVALNLWGNRLQNADRVIQEITKCKNLRALWLNENPVLENCGNYVANATREGISSLEIYNSCFTNNPSEWALGFCRGIIGVDNPVFNLETASALEASSSLDLSDRRINNLPKLHNCFFKQQQLPQTDSILPP